MQDDELDDLGVLLGWLCAPLAVCFLPFGRAALRGHHDTCSIPVLNPFLGCLRSARGGSAA